MQLFSLKPEQRAPLLDLLHAKPEFACLFAYIPGPTADQSVAAAQTTRCTPETKALLQSLAARARALDILPPVPEVEMSEAGADEQEQPPAPPALSLAVHPEFERYGPTVAAPAAAAAEGGGTSTQPPQTPAGEVEVRAVVSLKVSFECGVWARSCLLHSSG